MNLLMCNQTIERVFEALKKKREGNLQREDIVDVLHKRDDTFEFKRYGARVTIDEFTEYFMSFEKMKTVQLDNKDLRNHHRYWLDLYANQSRYEQKARAFFRKLDETAVASAYKIAVNGFPKGYELDELQLIFTCGIGQSYGYPYKNGIHFDVLQMLKENRDICFKETLAHEIHHLIYNKNVRPEKHSLIGYFVQCFSGEGLAVKFTNNVQGVFSKKFVSDMPENIGVDAFSFAYLNHDFESTYSKFRETIYRMEDGQIKTFEELDRLFYDYWLDCRVEGQTKNEVPKLKQSRLYSLGNDLWGVLYDVFGMDELYRIVRNPALFIDKYNRALDVIGREAYKIRINTTVQK